MTRFEKLKKKWAYQWLWPSLARLPKRLAYPLAIKLDRRFKGDLHRMHADWHGLQQVAKALPQAPTDHEFFHARWAMFARERLESYRLAHMTADDFLAQVTLTGAQDAHQAVAAGHGAVLIMAHFGRPVMLCSALAHTGLHIGMLTGSVDEHTLVDPVDLWYHQVGMRNTLLHAKGRWVTLSDNLRLLYQALKEGEIIIIMMDVPSAAAGNVSFPFLQGTLNLPQGVLRLVNKTGAKLLYGSATEIADHRVAAHIQRLNDNPEVAFREAVALFEQDVKKAPAQWWQWNNLPSLWSPE